MALRKDLEIIVHVRDSRGERPLRARGLTPKGMFIKTDAPHPVRGLVRLRIELEDDELETMAMVTRRVMPAIAAQEGTAPGMGVELYGLRGAKRESWEAFLESLATRYARDDSERAGPPAPPPPPPVHTSGGAAAPADAIRRRHVRYEVELDVRLIGDDYEETTTRDISAGGACVYTGQTLEPGQEIDLVVLAPDHVGADFASSFQTQAKVIRRFVPAGAKRSAVGVAFVIDEERQKELEKLILASLPDEDDELELVEIVD